MTFVACQQELILHGPPHFLTDEKFWCLLSTLADDSILDVRIRLARLVGLACQRLFQEGKQIISSLRNLALRLRHDQADNVKAYIPHLPLSNHNHREAKDRSNPCWIKTTTAIFSRPPLPCSLAFPPNKEDGRLQGLTANVDQLPLPVAGCFTLADKPSVSGGMDAGLTGMTGCIV